MSTQAGGLVFVKGCQPDHLVVWFPKRSDLALTSNGDEHFQAVVRRDNFKARAVQLPAKPGSAEGVWGRGTKTPWPTHLINIALGGYVLEPLQPPCSMEVLITSPNFPWPSQ